MQIMPCHETIGSINTKLSEYLRSIKFDCYSFLFYREYMGVKANIHISKQDVFLWDIREVCKVAKQLIGFSTNP